MDAFEFTIAPVTTTTTQEVEIPSDFEDGNPGGSNGCVVA
ncbi:hypothetical protein EUX98_g7102 [Antrodiella citrinella]|uniref:Uncharacterized protein n=1 Tax=Antrodiella citrinella TaxID=2447956 RepID=A0A4S4MME3_9APHY|nr:hypothetical protein EUX98_g7102 [Antrodiella citrinella]